MKKIFAVMLILFNLIQANIYAQSNTWKSYTDGHTVIDMTQDSNLLWIATTGGLIRIDLVNQDTTFITKSEEDFGSYNISAITVDKQHRLWMDCAGFPSMEGIYMYDGNTWTRNPFNFAPTSLSIADVEADPAGNIWVGTLLWIDFGTNPPTDHPGGLYCFNGNSWINYTSALSYTGAYQISFDKLGKTYVSDGNRLNIFDGSNWSFQKPFSYLYKFAIDTANHVWAINNTDTLSMFNGSSWTHFISSISFPPYYTDNYSIVADSANNIWLGSSVSNTTGLVRFDGNNWTNFSTTNSSLPGNRISSLHCFDGKIYAGTSGFGLSILDTGQVWTQVNTSNSPILGNEIPTSLYADHDSVCFMDYNTLTGFSSMRVLSGSQWSEISNIPTNFGKEIFRDSQHKLWLTGANGAACYDGNAWTIYNMANAGFPHNNVNCITEDSSGNIWIAGGSEFNQKFVASYNGTQWSIYSPPSVVHEFISIAIDDHYNKWLTAGTQILYQLDSAGIWSSYNLNDLFSVYESRIVKFNNKNNTLWLATDEGLIRYDFTQFNPITNYGLYNLDIDKNGNIWISNYYADDLLVFNPDGNLIYSFSAFSTGFPSNSTVEKIAVSDACDVYLATKDNGLVVYSNANWLDISGPVSPKNNSLKIYPNPGNELIHIVTEDLPLLLNIQVLGMDNRIFRSFTLKNTGEDISLDIKDLSGGVYFIAINNSYYQKVVIAH